MAEDPQPIEQGSMLVATSMLKAPAPVARLRFLPRTMPLGQLFIVAGSAVLGFLIATVFVGASLDAIIYGALIGGVLGYMGTRLSPLKGEGIGTWLGLQAQSGTAKRVEIDGERCIRYIGYAPLHWAASGHTRIIPGSLEVRAKSWDERGYPQWGTSAPTGGEVNSTVSLLERHSAAKRRKNGNTNPLRPAAGMSLNEVMSKQEAAKKKQTRKVRQQLPSQRTTTKPKKKQKPKTPTLQPTGGSLRPTGGSTKTTAPAKKKKKKRRK